MKPVSSSATSEGLIEASSQLRDKLAHLKFSAPVTHVYNPLMYAWEPHEDYLRKYGCRPRRIVFLGMNPGPFGMVQTGVPFGEIRAVRDWLRVKGAVGKPLWEHPRRPVTGFECVRSEVSGQRLWGLFAKRFRTPEQFFAEHLVMNYCPLAFVESTGRNRTPDKLPASERAALFAACDEHLKSIVALLKPEWVIGVGDFALKRARLVFSGGTPKIGGILHPSPASPAANRDWANVVIRQLKGLGIW